MPFNKPFQHQSSAIASYNAIDIFSGTGITNFYAGTTVDKNLLSNVTFYSDTIFTSGGIASGGYINAIDKDFDVLINRPMQIEGTTVINVPIRYIGVEGGTNTSVYAIVNVRKWDGTTETNIVSNTSRVFDSETETANVWQYSMLAVDVTIPPTTFGEGEYLRLTVEGWGTSAATHAYLNIAHDPMGRKTDGIVLAANIWDTAEQPSTLIFQVPQRIDI